MSSQRSIHYQVAFETGWKSLLNNWTWLLALAVGYLALEALPYAVERLAPSSWTFRSLASLLRMVGQTVFWTFALLLCIELARKDGAKPADFASQDVTLTKVLWMLAFVLLYGAVVAVGLILFIVPGVLWALEFSLAPFYIVRDGDDAIEAMRRSRALTKGLRWDLLLFYLLCGAALGLGFLALVVGLIPAMLVTTVAQAHVFLSLSGQVEDAGDQEGWTPS